MSRCCGKVAYRDKIAAQLALARLQRQDKAGHTESRVYGPCSRGKWHLTSQKERK